MAVLHLVQLFSVLEPAVAKNFADVTDYDKALFVDQAYLVFQFPKLLLIQYSVQHHFVVIVVIAFYLDECYASVQILIDEFGDFVQLFGDDIYGLCELYPFLDASGNEGDDNDGT